MGAVGLAWCVSGVSALLGVMLSLITYVPPGPGPVARALPAVFGGVAVGFAGVAAGLWLLPQTHRVRRSYPLRVTLGVVLAALVGLVLLMVVG